MEFLMIFRSLCKIKNSSHDRNLGFDKLCMYVCMYLFVYLNSETLIPQKSGTAVLKVVPRFPDFFLRVIVFSIYSMKSPDINFSVSTVGL